VKVKVEPEVDDSSTQMDIKTTTLEKVFSKAYPAAATLKAIPVDSVYKVFVEYCKTQIKKVKPMSFRYPEITQNGDVHVGIEVELENYQSTGNDAFHELRGFLESVWECKTDPSLRNEGREFVTRPGIKASQVPKALAILRMWLELVCSQDVQFTYRTSTHIHISVRDFTVEEFINFTVLYLLFEDSLYRFSGNRYKNIFCVPLRASSSSVERLFNLVHKPRPTYDNLRSVFRHFKKYMAFNLLPAGVTKANPLPGAWSDGPGNTGVKCIGTVEFRHHEGENDPYKLIPWLQKILDLHHSARTRSFKDLWRIVKNLNSISNYMQFHADVFTEGFTYKPEEIAQDMYEGSGFLKELFLISKGT
jgi:hypothetical protein